MQRVTVRLPRLPLRHRLAAVVVVGLLTFGSPAPRPVPLLAPPAIVRLQPTSAAAARWRELVPQRASPN
jgi:hypothetical protein